LDGPRKQQDSRLTAPSASRGLLVSLVGARNIATPPFTLGEGLSVLLGCAPPCDVVVQGLREGRVRFLQRKGELFIEPVMGSPVSINGVPIAVMTRIGSGDWLLLGQTVYQMQIAIERSGAQDNLPVDGVSAKDPQLAAVTRVEVPKALNGNISIGRLLENTICIPSPAVSRQHARVVLSSGRSIIEDLGSTNGTFVNGDRIHGRKSLDSGDRVQFGPFTYVFQGGSLREAAGAGLIRLEARAIGKAVRDAATRRHKVLLADVSFAINPGEFVGIFGTTGSGKSTLMDALNGRRPASSGAVFYNELDFYRCFDLFKASIGYVPQQDIVHRRITIHNALAYTARLRLPEDTSATEIEGHITRVLARVGLAEKTWQPIETPAPLSGGQLKRVSLAVELVSNPSILFLDEATSGLDAGTDRRMMQLFAELARDGKTVVCVTHTLENIETCDLILLLHRGRLVYFGPPDAAAEYFRVSRISDVYDLLEQSSAEHWAERYEASAFHRRYVTDRLAEGRHPAAADAATGHSAEGKEQHGALDWRQTKILTRRYLDLFASDRRNLALLLLQAPIIGLIIGKVFNPGSALETRSRIESQVMFVLVLSGIWLGCLNSAREVVKELPIYLRERSVNLKILAYLLSKLIPLAGLCAFQCVALLVAVGCLVSIPGSWMERGVTFFITAMTASAMGLTISASVASADKAIAMVPVVLIPQVILSGAIVTLQGSTKTFAQWSMISYWSFDCMKATLASDVRNLVDVEHGFGVDLGVLALFFAAFVLAAAAGLRLRDRRR
jgi:ABC transport system ATP-binding/permease protein